MKPTKEIHLRRSNYVITFYILVKVLSPLYAPFTVQQIHPTDKQKEENTAREKICTGCFKSVDQP